MYIHVCAGGYVMLYKMFIFVSSWVWFHSKTPNNFVTLFIVTGNMFITKLFFLFSQTLLCSAHMLAAERAVSSAICIAIIVVGRRLRGITVCKPLGLFGNASVTSTDVSYNMLGECNIHHSNGRSAGQGQLIKLGVVIKGILLFFHDYKIHNWLELSINISFIY